MLRVQLAFRLNELIEEQRLTQSAVAKLFGIPQQQASDLMNYRLSRFSSERVALFIALLDPESDAAKNAFERGRKRYRNALQRLAK